MPAAYSSIDIIEDQKIVRWTVIVNREGNQSGCQIPVFPSFIVKTALVSNFPKYKDIVGARGLAVVLPVVVQADSTFGWHREWSLFQKISFKFASLKEAIGSWSYVNPDADNGLIGSGTARVAERDGSNHFVLLLSQFHLMDEYLRSFRKIQNVSTDLGGIGCLLGIGAWRNMRTT